MSAASCSACVATTSGSLLILGAAIAAITATTTIATMSSVSVNPRAKIAGPEQVADIVFSVLSRAQQKGRAPCGCPPLPETPRCSERRLLTTACRRGAYDEGDCRCCLRVGERAVRGGRRTGELIGHHSPNRCRRIRGGVQAYRVVDTARGPGRKAVGHRDHGTLHCDRGPRPQAINSLQGVSQSRCRTDRSSRPVQGGNPSFSGH